MADLLYGTDIVWRLVATIDALPRKQLAQRLLPVQSPKGSFLAREQDGRWAIDPENNRRYATYVALVEHVDSKRLVETYLLFYPLFQEEYRMLGHPDGNFNDRLVAVIDDLLAAPSAAEPIALVRPKVFYEFEDSELEQLSAGKKIMLRIGEANARTVKRKLAEIRRQIVGVSRPH